MDIVRINHKHHKLNKSILLNSSNLDPDKEITKELVLDKITKQAFKGLEMKGLNHQLTIILLEIR